MSLKDLLSMLDDESIYTYYLGSIKIGKLINSPLRSDDRNPSFAIFRGKQGGLFFKDHGTGDGGNALKFVKLIKGIETREEFERELLRIVRKMNPNMSIRQQAYTQNVSNVMDIGIVRQPFTDIDKRYWKQFHISLDTLKCLALNTFFVIESSEEPTKKLILCMHTKCMIDLRFIDL